MSRGGRGGFRGGGGGGAQSGAMQLVSFDLLKDLGSGSLFNVNTALFPEMDVPMPRKPTATEKRQHACKEECHELLKTLPFYLTPPPPPPDIERYSDKYRSANAKKRTLRDIWTDLDFFPEELQSIIDPSKAKRNEEHTTRAGYSFADIEALLNAESKEGKEDEEEGKEGDEEKKEEGEGEEGYEEEYEDEEDLVDDNDYAQNYFDNGEGDDIDDDEGDGGDYY